MLRISRQLCLAEDEIQISAIRAQGAGGQNVNKLATAIHLRFDIHASSLPEPVKRRLLACADHRITKDGVIVIKAQQYRSQEKNRQAALQRLAELIRGVMVTKKKRYATKPTRSSQRRRLEQKSRHGAKKAWRGKVAAD